MANGVETGTEPQQPSVSEWLTQHGYNQQPTTGASSAATPTGDDSRPSVSEYLEKNYPGYIAPEPPASQWGGILGRTFEHVAAPYGYGDLALGMAATGQPVPSLGQIEAAAPDTPHYGGTLGYLQAGTRTLANPITATGALAFPLATIGGTAASEAVRQAGGGPWAQTAAGFAGGMGLPGAWDVTGGRLLGSSVEAAIPAVDPAAAVAARLGTKAGVEEPASSTPMDLAHEVGSVVQDESGNEIARMAAKREATAKLMKARATKVAKGTGPASPVDDPGTTYLKAVSDERQTPIQSLQTALSSPQYFRSLPEPARDAIGHWFASRASVDPEPWLRMDPGHQEFIIPDKAERGAVTLSAQNAQNAANAKAAADEAAANRPGLLRRIPGMVKSAVQHHWQKPALATAATAGAHALGLSSPVAEGIGATVAAVPAGVRYLARNPLQLTRGVVGAGDANSGLQIPVGP